MNTPYTVESFLRDRAEQGKRRLPGFWITVKVTDENDDDLDLECRVNVHEERDAYGTGDSPTMYEVDIFEVTCNDEAVPNGEYTYYAKIVAAAIDEYRGY